MKSLAQYIVEASDENTVRLNSVTVTYNCEPSNFTVKCPESYQEADVVQYMNDKLLNELPSSQKFADTFFGKNADNIYDTYFEYDDFSRDAESSETPDLDWDSHYAAKNHSDDEQLNVFTVTNLTYVIKFDRFDLVNVDKNNIQSELEKIFDATVSNDDNDYPIKISLDHKNISYT